MSQTARIASVAFAVSLACTMTTTAFAEPLGFSAPLQSGANGRRDLSGMF